MLILRMLLLKCTVLLLLGVSICQGSLNREPKFFFVTTSTSTSVTTTTSNLSGSQTCLILTKAAYMPCPQRRRKSLSLDHRDSSSFDIVATRVDRGFDEGLPQIEGSNQMVEKGSNRAARFAWYYMTTTITSVSTSTSTSTTFGVTVSVSALNCTPSQFVACGGGGK